MTAPASKPSAESGTGASRRCTSAKAAAVLGLLALTAVTIGLIMGSVRARSEATALTDLRIAVISALDVGTTGDVTAEDQRQLRMSIDVLSQSRELVVDVFGDAGEADRLSQHLVRIEAGEMLPSEVHSVAGHASFEEGIRLAIAASDGDATALERASTAAAIVTFVVLVVLVSRGLAAKFRRAKQEARSVGYRVAAERFEHLSLTDDLTGLLNRRALMQYIALLQGVGALLMIDLDDFKRVNDTRGHSEGDLLLQKLGKRIQAEITDDAKLFRLGGDEFAVLTSEADDDHLCALASRIVASLTEPVQLESGDEEITPSIGIAKYGARESDMSLLRGADVAMYEAKSEGGRCYRLLRPELEARAERRRSIGLGLASIDLDSELRMVYQPIMDAAAGEVAIVEALVRWTNPTLGVVTPDEFIPRAESSGHIVRLGLWIFERALRDVSEWRARGTDLSVSINVSPRQLEESSFVSEVLRLLAVYDIAAGSIVLEVTESALVGPDHVAVERLLALRSAGCSIACDDFGSGYSNLGQLLSLPLDLIKIDAQLLNQLSKLSDASAEGTEKQRHILQAISAVGGSMSALIVAEGVETRAQERALRDSGIDYLQGYLFSRPVEVDQVVGVVADLAQSGLVTEPAR